MAFCTTTGLIQILFFPWNVLLKNILSGSCFNYHHHHWMALRQLFPPAHTARPVDLSFFFSTNHKWFWGRIKIPVGVYHLKPVQDLLYVDVCVSKKDKDKDKDTRKEMGEYIGFFCCFSHATCVIKCTSVFSSVPGEMHMVFPHTAYACARLPAVYTLPLPLMLHHIRWRLLVCLHMCESVCVCVCGFAGVRGGMSVCLFKRTKERTRGRRWEGAKMHYVNYVSECVCACVCPHAYSSRYKWAS